MTQPTEAVGGGSNDTVIAAEPTIEDRFAAVIEQPEEEPGEPEEVEAEAEAPEPELAPEDLTEEPEAQAAEESDEPAPIKPPVSWNAEEQEEFKSLPRALQETLTRREAEREKFVQSKAQEAKQARSQVESEARAALQQMQATYAQQIEALLPPLAPQPPMSMLDINSGDYDPDQYHYQRAIFENSVAQRQWAQQQLSQIDHQRTQAERAARDEALRAETEALKEKLPEWFDDTEGPKLRESVKSIGLDLGFSAEQLNDVTATEILALKRVSELKAKADKYDTLMAKKMETVRAAKAMPRVSKPGVPVGKGQIANERYTADRNAMKHGDREAEKRVFARFV